MELLRRGANNDIFKLRETRSDMEEIRQRAKLYLNRANGKLLQNYRTQISALTTCSKCYEKTISFQIANPNRKYLQER
ncbi:hypothetical protein H5410_046158 [Solanum commersonii]|uniref:Uncharacterized protein n=1 Tax=Solanum commersonii TaxID=4109 RepID=A0A9J5XER7_SOLCO|nr:hypothetical protein H5410_046158 [Solanum commersonii]